MRGLHCHRPAGVLKRTKAYIMFSTHIIPVSNVYLVSFLVSYSDNISQGAGDGIAYWPVGFQLAALAGTEVWGVSERDAFLEEAYLDGARIAGGFDRAVR